MKKVLIGCGVALGLAVLGTVLASVLALRYFRTTMPDAAHLEERQEELVDRFGRPQDYLPPLDGRLEPARIETFLRVREGLPALGERLQESLVEVRQAQDELNDTKGLAKVLKGIRMARQGMDVASLAMRGLVVRDSLLLAEGMGLGEYDYLLAMGPIAWLRWDPPQCQGDAGVLGDHEDELDVLEEGREDLGRIVRRQLEAVRDSLQAAPELDQDERAWLEVLQQQLGRERLGASLLPLEGTLPDFAVQAWQPYRDRLEATLPPCRETWILELVSLRKQDERGVRVRLGNRDEG